LRLSAANHLAISVMIPHNTHQVAFVILTSTWEEI